MLVEGQLVGGLAQGLGGSLYEVCYDSEVSLCPWPLLTI